MKNPDAIVIGAGLVGACSALSLVNAGLRVLVLDRGPVASGTTGAGEGNILVSDKEPSAELTLALRSRDAWFEINTDIGGGFELEDKGGVVVSRSEKGISDLKKLSAIQAQHGIEVVELDAKGIKAIEPHISDSVEYAVLYPQDAQCQPMLAAAQIMRAVKKRGGAFIQGENVKSINVKSGKVVGLTTEKNTYACPIVINATGTWAGEIAKMAGSYLPIMPRRGFILVTAPAPKIVHHKVYDADYVANVASSDADLQSSAVVEGTESGTILIGASRERVGFKSDLDVAVLRQLARQAISLFPVLSNIALLRAYRGFRPYAPDHLPVIGEDANVKGLWHAAGHEGAGIGLAPATGELITAQITSTKTFMDPTPFSPKDSRKLQMSQFNIEFTFDGESISAITGQSVAAALLAANQRALRKTRFNNNERGVFCGIGVCFDCLVVIDGITNQRACLIEARPGMKVQTQVGSDA